VNSFDFQQTVARQLAATACG
ncbi:hypothetical protein EE612_041227, partial [Oryza sativa]